MRVVFVAVLLLLGAVGWAQERSDSPEYVRGLELRLVEMSERLERMERRLVQLQSVSVDNYVTSQTHTQMLKQVIFEVLAHDAQTFLLHCLENLDGECERQEEAWRRAGEIKAKQAELVLERLSNPVEYAKEALEIIEIESIE